MPEARKTNVNLSFPINGIVDGSSHTNQPENTTHDAKNVVPFDTSEGRLRGGRRRGVKKTTNTALANESIQLLMSSDITTGAGELAAGGVSYWSDDHPELPNVPALFNFDTLADGTQVDANSFPFTVYGSANTHARNAGNTGTNSYLTDNSVNGNKFINNGWGILQGLDDDHNVYRARPWILKSGTACSFKGLTKKSDDGGSYLEIDPSRFEYQRGTSGGTRSSSHSYASDLCFLPTGQNGFDLMNNPSTDFRNGSDIITFYKSACLLPEHDFDENPFNSQAGKTYVTKLEIKLPEGSRHTFPDGRIQFVSELANETTDNHLYDPWYRRLANNNDEGTDNRFEPWNDLDEQVGLLFRVGADFSDVTNPNNDNVNDWCYDFYKNTSSKTGFAIMFRRNVPPGFEGDFTELGWDLVFRTLRFGHNQAYGPDSQAETIAINAVVPGDNSYQTLEVRAARNRIDIYLNGILRKSFEDIRIDYPIIAGNEGSDLTDSFGYGGIGYYSKRNIKRTNASAGTSATKRQVSYWSSFDWETRLNNSGKSVNNQHTDTRTGGHALRIRNFEWREANVNETGSRVVVAVCAGDVYESESGSSFSKISTTSALNSSARIVDGINYFQKVYLVDGSNYTIFNPATNTVEDWSATGTVTLPGGDGPEGLNGAGVSDGNPRCSIIEVYNGRVVMAGKSDDPHNWFMSAIGDPLDWNIAESIDMGGAVIGSSSSIGESSDPITALIPTTDDRLIIGGKNSMHILTGDPSSPATQLVSVSKEIGIVGQEAWCYGPNKSVFFMGENGLYSLQPNEFDVAQNNRVSLGKLDKTFTDIDFSTYRCNLMYDHSLYGVHIFLNPQTRNNNALTHYFYDTRSNSFWQMEMPSIVGPTSVLDYQHLDPTARKILMGGYDGHVRTFNNDSKDDDGTKIDSHVWIGPLQISADRESKLTQLIAVLDEQTDGLGYEIYAADTVEAAKASEPIVSGEWSSGRNASARMRVRGSAIFVRLKSDAVALPWSIESLTATLAVAGKVRQR